MKLDARKPVVVLLGAWNPAIFHPAWVAINILDIKQGSNFQAQMLQIFPEEKTIIFLAGSPVGYFVDNTRCELYIKNYSDENLKLLGNFIEKIVSVLRHTPFSDFGVNFQFIEESPETEIIDKLTSNDHID